MDGASTGPNTRSGSLSGEGDRQLFHALRGVADVVLAGAGTVRAENYGAPRGEGHRPRLAVVSASLALDPAARFFQEPDEPSIVLTTEDALDGGQAEQLSAVADVRAVGAHSLDWPAALRLLRHDYGAKTLLVEGGPSLNTQLVAEDLVDELRLTVAPLLVGGAARRIVAPGAPAQTLALTLDEVTEEDGFLFLRYLRDRH